VCFDSCSRGPSIFVARVVRPQHAPGTGQSDRDEASSPTGAVFRKALSRGSARAKPPSFGLHLVARFDFAEPWHFRELLGTPRT
jgi:hypothetical protein